MCWSIRSLIRALFVVGLFVSLGGCASDVAPSGSHPNSRPSEPPGYADAVRFRTTHGLRSDAAWISEVASDPASEAGVRLYGIPLTEVEIQDLDARARVAAEVATAVERYGQAHPDDWGGAFMDQASGLIVAQFTGNMTDHETALARALNPQARVKVVQVRWRLRDLETWQRSIAADTGFLRSLNAWFDRVGVDVPNNRVAFGISSADASAPALVSAHFGDPDWLTVTADGIGHWEGPRGTLVVAAVESVGRPVPSLDCVLTPDVPAAWRGNLAVGTDESGECTIEGVGASGYLVELKAYSVADSTWKTVGSARTLVAGATVTRLRVRVDPTRAGELP